MSLLARFQSMPRETQYETVSVITAPAFQALIQGELALLKQQRTNAAIPEPGSPDELKYVQEMRILRMRETVLDEFNQIINYAHGVLREEYEEPQS